MARIGIDGDERDDVPFLRKIGGIHNKPWRGIITQKEGGSLDKDSNKAWITITDLGISQYVDMSDIFLPSEEISSVRKKFMQFLSVYKSFQILIISTVCIKDSVGQVRLLGSY